MWVTTGGGWGRGGGLLGQTGTGKQAGNMGSSRMEPPGEWPGDLVNECD